MNDYLKISSPRARLGWYVLFLGGGVVIASLVIAIVVIAVQGLGPGHIRADLAAPEYVGLMKLLQALSTLIIFLLPAVLFARFVYRKEPFHQLGFRKASKDGFYALGIALLLLSLPFGGWLGELNHAIPLPGWILHREKEADQEIVAFLKTGSFAGVLVNLFIIAVLPAICEEACFRGALQPILIRSFRSPWAGIVVTAIFFSAFHMQFQGFLPRMFLGILLGAVYWYSGSLWASILAHFFTNAVQVIAVSYYPKYITEDPSVPLAAVLVSMIIVVCLLLFLHRYSDVDYAKVYAEEIP